ncbi:RDD family protein [bacterium]|nr:RDD family protein [bacterium]MBU1958397.1 RDD family protein [bacterium]
MAKKQRFRDTKQGNKTNLSKKNSVKKPSIPFAGNVIKAKAFLTDTFMLFMPIFYFVIYVVFGSLQAASEHKLLAWGYALVPFLILQTIFMYKDQGRTPGARANGLKVIDIHTLDKPSLFSIFFRNLALILSILTLFGWIMMFFRKDKRGLHDFLSNTCVIPYKDRKNLETKNDNQ